MSFPKLEVPQLTCELPISKQTVTYRPYTVKEENIMNLAATEQNKEQLAKDIIVSVYNLIKACVVGKLNIDQLTVIDIEYLFLKIKMASAGSVRTKTYSCNLKNEQGKVCGGNNTIDIDLDTIALNNELPKEDKVVLTDEITLVLQPPMFDSVKRNATKKKDVSSIEQVASCVKMVIHGEEVFSEFSEKELVDNILNNMTEQQSQLFKEYFTALPELALNVEFTCGKCKSEHAIEVKGLVNFFG